jgi:hypothetical protein
MSCHSQNLCGTFELPRLVLKVGKVEPDQERFMLIFSPLRMSRGNGNNKVSRFIKVFCHTEFMILGHTNT